MPIKSGIKCGIKWVLRATLCLHTLSPRFVGYASSPHFVPTLCRKRKSKRQRCLRLADKVQRQGVETRCATGRRKGSAALTSLNCEPLCGRNNRPATAYCHCLLPPGGERAAQRFYPLNCEPLCGRNNCLLPLPTATAGRPIGAAACCAALSRSKRYTSGSSSGATWLRSSRQDLMVSAEERDASASSARARALFERRLADGVLDDGNRAWRHAQLVDPHADQQQGRQRIRGHLATDADGTVVPPSGLDGEGDQPQHGRMGS